jgi:hypothetical protein
MITEQQIAVGPLCCQASRDSVKKMALPYLTEQYGWDSPSIATFFCFGPNLKRNLMAGWMDDGGSYFRQKGYRIVSPDDLDLADWFQRKGWEKKAEWEFDAAIHKARIRSRIGKMEIAYQTVSSGWIEIDGIDQDTLRRALDIADPQPQIDLMKIDCIRRNNDRLRAELVRVKADNEFLRVCRDSGLMELAVLKAKPDPELMNDVYQIQKASVDIQCKSARVMDKLKGRP